MLLLAMALPTVQTRAKNEKVIIIKCSYVMHTIMSAGHCAGHCAERSIIVYNALFICMVINYYYYYYYIRTI